MEIENPEIVYLAFCHAIRKNFLEKFIRHQKGVLYLKEWHPLKGGLCW
jgi:hypothetical protein